MSLNLTRKLQDPSSVNVVQAGPNAGRQVGVFLQDTASVAWTEDQYGNVTATASGSGSSLPTATAANQVPVSTGAGTTYTAAFPLPTATAAGQIPVATGAGNAYTAQAQAVTLISETAVTNGAASLTLTLPSGYKYFKLIGNAQNASNAANNYALQFNGDTTAGDYFYSQITAGFSNSAPGVAGGFTNSTGVPIPSNQSDTTLYIASTTPSVGVSSHGNSATGGIALFLSAGQWNVATAPTSVTINCVGSTFTTGQFTLFGLN